MSKESILKKIRKNRPPETPLPEINPERFFAGINLVEEFINNAELSAEKVVVAGSISEAEIQIKNLYKETSGIISLVRGINLGTDKIDESISPKELEKFNTAILEGEFGVAENGAVWVKGSKLPHRLIPFITKHLILVLNADRLVENMHEAYAGISLNSEGFGVFISGPSKTADIEQSLVIGAQGPLSSTVFLISH